MTASPKRRPRRIAADEAHAWARNLRLGNPIAKLVLSMLTIYVNAEGSCFVSIGQLAEDCEIAENTVRRRLEFLESIGAIARFPQWRDENGRLNGENRGKRTTDDIRLLTNTDTDEIEARAKGNGDGGDGHDDGADGDSRGSPGEGLTDQNRGSPGEGLNPVSPSVGVQQPSHCGEGLMSEPEPVINPPTPLKGGARSDVDVQLEESLAPFISAWPDPITDLVKTKQIWSAMTELERSDAVTGAKGYARFLADKKSSGQSRNVKNAHLWLRDRQWLGYLDSGKVAETAAERTDIAEGSPQWQAWDVFYKCCGRAVGIADFQIRHTPEGRVANVPREWPPVGAGLQSNRHKWILVIEGSGQFAAWLRRLREMPGISIATPSEHIDGKFVATLKVPCEWPPPKGSTGPPPPPVTDAELKDFTG